MRHPGQGLYSGGLGNGWMQAADNRRRQRGRTGSWLAAGIAVSWQDLAPASCAFSPAEALALMPVSCLLARSTTKEHA
jgi:hypothetical protein